MVEKLIDFAAFVEPEVVSDVGACCERHSVVRSAERKVSSKRAMDRWLADTAEKCQEREGSRCHCPHSTLRSCSDHNIEQRHNIVDNIRVNTVRVTLHSGHYYRDSRGDTDPGAEVTSHPMRENA